MAADGPGTLKHAAAATDPVIPAPAIAIASGPVAHAFRPTIFAGPQSYLLDQATLQRTTNGVTTVLPLADIERIRIYSVPGIGPALRRAVLKLRAHPKVILQGTSFERLGRVADRGESYRRIVEALVQRVAVANPAVQVFVGPPTSLWAFWLIVVIGSIVVVALALVMMMAGDLPISSGLYLGLVASYLPLGWRVVRTGRGKRVDARSLPPSIFAS